VYCNPCGRPPRGALGPDDISCSGDIRDLFLRNGGDSRSSLRQFQGRERKGGGEAGGYCYGCAEFIYISESQQVS